MSHEFNSPLNVILNGFDCIFHYLFLVDIVGSEAEVMHYASVSVLHYCSVLIFTLNYHVEVFVMRLFLCFRFQVKIVVDVSLKLLHVTV